LKEGLKMGNIGLQHVARVTLCRKYTKSHVDGVKSFIMSPANSTKELAEVHWGSLKRTMLKRCYNEQFLSTKLGYYNE
jgi:hypothetical protein